MEERLNKVLARAGIASRRGADELIAAGRIKVNGQVITDLGTRVDPGSDEIRFDGEEIHPERVPNRYVVLNKPPHVITTASDPYDRSTVMDFVDPDVRLFPVGRLDSESEGLLLLTNDGELANRLMHPRYEHEKEYRVKISGTPLDSTLKAWREGVWFEDGRTQPAQVTIESSTGSGTWLRFVLKEGKNRQIRRMVEAFSHTIHRLIRVRLGPITLGKLKPGAWRALNQAEIAALQAGSNEPIHRDQPPPSASMARKPVKYKKGWARPKTDRRGRGPTKRGPTKRGPRRGPPSKGPRSR